MKNTFGWMQLATSDPEKAKTFYEKLFNWTITSRETYTEIDDGNGPCGGISKGESPNESHWISFMNVNDIHESTEKAEKLGAQVVVPITDLGEDEGFFSVFVDPTGAVLGLYGKK
jgi:predicted enzyme related to lactoylglutathione lyase